MSDTFTKILVKQDTIGCITSAPKYSVLKGAQNNTSYTYNAISATNSSHVFNIAVPSLETILSREVLWESTLTLQIQANIDTGTGNSQKNPDMFLVNYGVTDALAAFPLHS
mgnify:CR=1 FL=1